MLKVVFVLLLFLSVRAFGSDDDGCYIGGKLYYDKTGTVSFYGIGTRYLYNPSVYYEEYSYNCFGSVAMAKRTSMASQGLFGSSIQCGFTGDSYSMAVRGYVWNFDIVLCPLDDYTFILLLFAASTGAYFLLKKARLVKVPNNC